MIEKLFSSVKGAFEELLSKTEEILHSTTEQRGESFEFEFPDTAYSLPLIYALEGVKLRKLSEFREFLEKTKVNFKNTPLNFDSVLNYLYLAEIYLALTYLNSGLRSKFEEDLVLTFHPKPAESVGSSSNGAQREVQLYYGFLGDTIQRTLGVQLVDGRIPGVALLLGNLHKEKLLSIIKELQEKRILSFLVGPLAQEFISTGERYGFEAYIVPVGLDTEEAVFVLDWAVRAALIFGGQSPGEKDKIIDYIRKRVNAFTIALGEIDQKAVTLALASAVFAIPVISDQEVPEVTIQEIASYPLLSSVREHSKIVREAIERRGLKIIVEKPPIPVAYGPAFEGERVRKEDTFIEFGGGRTPAFELVIMKDLSEIEDGKVEIVGSDAQTRYERGGSMPLGIVVNLAGRKMQKDFEPVIERQIHTFINEAEGLWHIGQRDINWIRISRKAKEAGITLEHLGLIVVTMTKARFRSIVDKVEVYLYVDEKDVLELRERARQEYKHRDQRIAKLVDEDVEEFYSCLLCQSFAPKHVCVITPERPGLCGAFTWLDAKAAYEIEPTGGNQPVHKGTLIDSSLGVYSGVNQYVKKHSGGEIETISLYSIMENPMTSCGCFECIVAVVPEANGVMIVNRGFSGMTPIGMKFSTIAGMIGGGVQTPGFMGVGVNYISSRKFLKGDGGIRRIVWMPKELKERVRESLKRRAEEEGIPDFVEKIADETVCSEIECLLEFLTEVNHPALEMEPIIK